MKKKLSIFTLLLALLFIASCDNGSVSDSAVPKSSGLVKVSLTVDGESSGSQKSVAVDGTYWTSLTYHYNAVPQWRDPQGANIHGTAAWTPINYFEGISLGYFAPGQWVFGVRVLNGSTVVYEGFSDVIDVKNSSVNVEVFVNKLVKAAVAKSVRVSVTAPTEQNEELSITYSGGTISTTDPEGISAISSGGITTFEYIFNNINTASFVLSHSGEDSGVINSESIPVSLGNSEMAVISGHLDNGIWQLEPHTVNVHGITIGNHQHGNVYVSGNIESAAIGDIVTLYIKADSNASFDGDLTVTCDNTHEVVTCTNIPLTLWYSFTMPDDDVTVAVNFVLKSETKINMPFFKTLLSSMYDNTPNNISLKFCRSDVAPNGVESLGIDGVNLWYEEGQNNTGTIYWHSSVNSNRLVFRDIDTDMSDFFKDCVKYVNIDMTGIDTLHITDMHGMFENCTNLKEVDLNGVVTGSVTDMHNMFYKAGYNYVYQKKDKPENGANMNDNANNLLIKNLRFNTGSVTNMAYMFYLSSINNLCTPESRNNNEIPSNIDEWDTSSVTDMSYMFAGWSGKINQTTYYMYNKIGSLDIAGKEVRTGEGVYWSWDVSSCTKFNNMFDYCNRLTSLDIHNWSFSTTNNIDMNRMFDRCESIQSIIFPDHTDLKKVTSLTLIFGSCPAIPLNGQNGIHGFTQILSRWDIRNCSIEFIANPSDAQGNGDSANRLVKNDSNQLKTQIKVNTYGEGGIGTGPEVQIGGSGLGNTYPPQRLVLTGN